MEKIRPRNKEILGGKDVVIFVKTKRPIWLGGDVERQAIDGCKTWKRILSLWYRKVVGKGVEKSEGDS